MILSYCCNIPRKKDISWMQHGGPVGSLCISRLTVMEGLGTCGKGGLRLFLR